MRKPILKHTHIIKLGRILDMLYKPAEIASEIGVNVDTIYRSYMPAGMPYSRDNKNNIWIHGPAFVSWAKTTVAKKKSQRQGLPNDHAWCMSCNTPQPMINPKIKHRNRFIIIMQAVCPACGKTINRAQAAGGAE